MGPGSNKGVPWSKGVRDGFRPLWRMSFLLFSQLPSDELVHYQQKLTELASCKVRRPISIIQFLLCRHLMVWGHAWALGLLRHGLMSINDPKCERVIRANLILSLPVRRTCKCLSVKQIQVLDTGTGTGILPAFPEENLFSDETYTKMFLLTVVSSDVIHVWISNVRCKWKDVLKDHQVLRDGAKYFANQINLVK